MSYLLLIFVGLLLLSCYLFVLNVRGAITSSYYSSSLFFMISLAFGIPPLLHWHLYYSGTPLKALSICIPHPAQEANPQD